LHANCEERMKKYLITYDLMAPGRNYNDLYAAIKGLGDAQHPLESMWVLKSEIQDVNAISQTLLREMDQNDRLFVIEVDSRYAHQGWLAKSFWEWFKN